ncbi:MAG TPA: TIM-barrel domain-containing protein [Capsulimonadaceae bacterium]|jgi:hypothetical protein
MRVTKLGDTITIDTFYYKVVLALDRFQLIDPRSAHVLIDSPTPLICHPELAGRDVAWTVTGVGIDAMECGPVALIVTATAAGINLTVTITCYDEYVEVAGVTNEFPAPDQVAHWHILADGSEFDMFHVHHWRNRHGHDATYETYNLAQGEHAGESLNPSLLPEIADQWTRVTEFTTYSTDWQFAPRPSFFLAQRDSVTLGIGARDLPHGFGLEMRSHGSKVKHLRFNYGGEHGFPVCRGQKAIAPRFYLWLDHGLRVWDSVDHYVRLLQADAAIPPRRDDREAPHWWTKPQYCTWNDQGLLAGSGVFYAWMGEKTVGNGAELSFDEAMLDYLVNRVIDERLNVGAIIIDAGWQKNWGDWVADPERFPNLRAQIDRIHAHGMKALLWIAPLDFRPGAPVLDHPEWLCGEGVRGRFGMPMLDYSNPLAQEGYVKPMARYLFSSEAGCLDADGFKSDFTAEKVQPVFPVHDPDWRGEERFVLNTLALIQTQMRRYKPDGMHVGGICHPFATRVQDVIRTYDVPKSQLQHENRAIMLSHFNPGNLVTIDLSESRSLVDIEQHIEIAERNNLLYELPVIAGDPDTGESRLGPDYMPLLRRKLRMWG